MYDKCFKKSVKW